MPKFIGFYEDTFAGPEALIGERPGMDPRPVITLTSRFAVDENGSVWRQGRWEDDGSVSWLQTPGDSYRSDTHLRLSDGTLRNSLGYVVATNVSTPYYPRKL
jgi:hypothetical protein